MRAALPDPTSLGPSGPNSVQAPGHPVPQATPCGSAPAAPKNRTPFSFFINAFLSVLHNCKCVSLQESSKCPPGNLEIPLFGVPSLPSTWILAPLLDFGFRKGLSYISLSFQHLPRSGHVLNACQVLNTQRCSLDNVSPFLPSTNGPQALFVQVLPHSNQSCPLHWPPHLHSLLALKAQIKPQPVSAASPAAPALIFSSTYSR